MMGKYDEEERTAFNEPSLSARDLEVLRLIAIENLTNQEIADRIHVSVSTVEKMLGNIDPFYSIYPKINANNRTSAVEWYHAWYHAAQKDAALREKEEELVERIVGDRKLIMTELQRELTQREVKIKKYRQDMEDFIEKECEELENRLYTARKSRLQHFLERLLHPFFKDREAQLEAKYKRELFIVESKNVLYKYLLDLRESNNNVMIDSRGFSDEEYATLLVLAKLGLMTTHMLEKFDLDDKVSGVLFGLHSKEYSPPPLSIRRTYYNVIKEDFTEEEYDYLMVFAERRDGITHDILVRIKAELVTDERGRNIVRRKHIDDDLMT